MWFGHVRDNRSCQILSVNGACPSLVICAVPTSVKTTPKLSGSAFRVLPKTGDEELEDRSKPGCEQLRMICTCSTSAWRWQDGALWIDRHSVYSRMWLRPRDTLQRERQVATVREQAMSLGVAGLCSPLWNSINTNAGCGAVLAEFCSIWRRDAHQWVVTFYLLSIHPFIMHKQQI